MVTSLNKMENIPKSYSYSKWFIIRRKTVRKLNPISGISKNKHKTKQYKEKYFNYFIFCVCMFGLPICICIICFSGTQEIRRGHLIPWNCSLQPVLSQHVDAGGREWGSREKQPVLSTCEPPLQLWGRILNFINKIILFYTPAYHYLPLWLLEQITDLAISFSEMSTLMEVLWYFK